MRLGTDPLLCSGVLISPRWQIHFRTGRGMDGKEEWRQRQMTSETNDVRSRETEMHADVRHVVTKRSKGEWKQVS